jgi:hypothetical protein
MTIRQAALQAQRLNRTEESRGSSTRYIVVADPIGSADCNYQVIPRRLRATQRR